MMQSKVIGVDGSDTVEMTFTGGTDVSVNEVLDELKKNGATALEKIGFEGTRLFELTLPLGVCGSDEARAFIKRILWNHRIEIVP